MSEGSTEQIEMTAGLDLGDKYSYLYVLEADASGLVTFFTQVPSNAFEWCWNTGSTESTTVGFREKVVEDDFPPSVMDYTVNLIP